MRFKGFAGIPAFLIVDCLLLPLFDQDMTVRAPWIGRNQSMHRIEEINDLRFLVGLGIYGDK